MPRSRPVRGGSSPISRPTWAAFIAGRGKPCSMPHPPAAIPRPDPDTDWAPWLREGGEALIDALAAVDLDAPTWHPFPVAQVARRVAAAPGPRDRRSTGGTPRRRSARRRRSTRSSRATGSTSTSRSSLPRLSVREQRRTPARQLPRALHRRRRRVARRATTATGCSVAREHAKGDAALRGPAEAILLRLWNRDSPRAAELDQVGDPAVAAAWLAIPGM